MKNSIRLLVAATVFAVAAPAAAQGGVDGLRRGDQAERQAQMQAQRRAQLFEGITLTAEQSAKIDTVQILTVARRREMMQAGGDFRSPEMREKMQEVQMEERKAIRGLLSAEQVVLFDKTLAVMASRRGGGNRPPER